MSRMTQTCLSVVFSLSVICHAPVISGQELSDESETAYGELGSLAFRVAPGVGLLDFAWSEYSNPGFTFGVGAGVHLSKGVRPELHVHYFEMAADGSSPRMFSYLLGFRFVLDLTLFTIEPSFMWGIFDPVENCEALPDGQQPCYDPGGNGPRLGLGVHVPVNDAISVGVDPSFQIFGDGQAYAWWDFPVVLTLRLVP